MKKITLWFLIVFTMVAFVPIVNSQTIIHQEDFEGADFSGYAIGNADTGTDYPSQTFQTSGTDYILRDVPTNFSFSQSLTGNSTNMIGGEDINTFYNGHSYIELDPISISGKSNLTIDIDVAFPNTLAARYEDNDFLIVDYRIDGTGSYTSVLAFNGNYGTLGCTRDDNLNGVTDAGEVTHVNQAMTTFNLDLNSITGSTVTGSTIEIRVRFSMPDSHEEFAFDNIVLKGSSSCTDPDVPTVTASPTSVCSGAQSTLTITGSLNDATQWAVYEGSCGGTLIATTNGSSVIVNPTSATTYYVRGEGGCVTPGSCGTVTVGVTAQDNAGFSYSASSYCANAADPTPTITGVTGGTFSSTAGLSISSSTGAIDVSASTPGTYTVTYTTAGACPNSSTASVTINAVDDASFSYSASAYCVNAADPTPTITGLTGGSFSSTAGLSISSSTGAIDVSASTPGSYTVTYTTAGTCPNSSTASVTINALDDASFSYSASAYCVNAADPTPTITGLTGGAFSSTAGLSISSSTGAIDVSASTPGSYTVTYTTAGTCANSSTASVTINALDDASFSYSASAYCTSAADPTPTITGLTGGSFSSTAGLSISSSTGAIDVSASTPGTYTITYTTAGSCPNSSTASVTINAADDASFSYSASAYCVNAADPTPTITGLTGGSFSSTAGLSISSSTGAIDVSASTPGTYTVTYTTAGTCANSSTASVTINALDDASFAYGASAFCISGSDPTPTITGLTGGTFSSTAGISINASTGAIDVSASVPNTYTITYTTAGSCPNASTVSVTINGDDDASFSYAASSYCSGDSDPTPTVTGLTGGTFSSTAGLSINATTGAIDLSASTAGTYTITYTTAGSCPTSATASVTITATDDASFTYASSSYCISGTNPTANITGVTGGTFSSSMGLNFISTATGELNLSASTPGAYTITYTTTGTCANSETFNITVLGDNGFTASVIVDANVSCNGGSTGQVTGSATGGTSPYTYAWNNSATTATITGVMAGTYAVEITDNTGCKSDAFATVTEPTALSSSISSSTNVGCNGGSTGAATVTATGGTAGYTYLWSNGATTASISGVVAGTYSVTVTDANSCTSTSSVTILEPSALLASTIVNSNVSCNGFTDGSATVSEIGGTAPYSYLWSNGSTAPLIAGVGAGTYTVVVTDANGCTANSSATITEPAVLLASGSVDNNVTCNGGADGGATVNVSGGTAPYAYMWDNGATTASIAGVTAGTYNVSVMDANACPAFSDATITEPAANVATISSQTNVSCNGGTDGAATVSMSGGTAPYTYLWSNGATTASISGVVAGTYTVTVTDANACTANATATITEPTSLSASISSQTNIDCNGNSTGAATASVTGGTSPYTYAWSNGATTASISGVVAGTYNLTVTDANACTTTTSVTITEPTVLAASGIVNANVSCNAGTDGEATVNVSGGTAPYTYAWSNAATTATITGVAAGTYNVTVTDANGCSTNTSVTITEPAVLAASGVVIANVSCNGGADGEAAVSVTGGTAPYTYAWNNTATTQTIIGITAGTYSVTITDANGCTATASVTITEPTVLSASGSVNANVSCNGATDGEGTVNVTGGTAPYIYTWSNAETTATITGIAAATYTVTVTDAKGCTANASVTITEPAVLSASGIVNANASCNGATDGGATVSATGGTAPYTYAWSNAATTATITGVGAGTYTVTVTDANGCTSNASVTITEPAVLSASGIVNANVSCNGGTDGEATVSVTGGTAPYTYAWSNAATTATITGVAAGTYNVTVTDANGCSTNTSVTITEPAVLAASGVVNANVSCNGGADGEATVSVTGGTAPYTYAWNNTATTQTITGITAGTYSVTITDANGCTTNASVTITEPAVLSASGIVNANASCNGATDGGATVSATGGTAPYTYAWNNAATTATITGVAAGTYTVTVTDANGCTANASVTITEPAVLSASGIVNANVSCNGATDGGATVSATGGTAPYTYAWSNAATTATITGVGAGTYTVTVTDANGCTSNASVTITEPAVLSASGIVNANVSCNGGTDGEATVSVTGGTAPYTYLWSNAATTATITGVAAGTYNVTVTDANGCSTNTSVTITEPAVLAASGVVNANVSCNGGADGEATVSVTGGTAPYTYAWNNTATTATITGLAAGTYSVTITDANGCTTTASATVTEPAVLSASGNVNANVSCNGGADGEATVNVTGGTAPYTYAWSNAATTATITGVAAGTYTVVVTDANGCTTNASVTITEPVVLSASGIVNANASCNGATDGGATVSAIGGTAPYTYAWSNAATTATITGVGAGTYTVTVTDANGCTSNASVTITEPAVLSASGIVNANVSCNGATDGEATVSVTGGTAPFTYAWSNAATTATITGVAAGTYNVTVTDANGCSTNTSVTITEPAALTANTVVDANVSCNGFTDGGATVSVSAGTAPYTYLWSNGATTASITGVGAGTYTVVVTDVNGCNSNGTVTITEPTLLVASASVNANVSCNGVTDGMAEVIASGGTAPYTYLWSNAATTASINGVAAGTYTVVVTDANGCTVNESVTITEPAVLVATGSINMNVSCNGASDGEATVSVTGGTAPYAYLWDNNATTATITGVVAGIYTVVVTDANGCTATESVTITEPDVLVATGVVNANVSCNGASDGEGTVQVTGGTAPFTYAWDNSATTQTIAGLVAGTYNVVVTDANGCTANATITITEPTTLSASAAVDANVSCNSLNDGGATVTATGGTAPYTYLWDNAATTATVTGLAAGTYNVVVTDANGCTENASVTITQPVVLAASLAEIVQISCFGGNNGAIDLTVTGGTTPYAFAWSNTATTEDLSGLSADTYSVTVTDANGCSVTESLTISEPTALVTSTTVDNNVSCNGGSNGGATVTATGGTAPYTYLWDNAETTASVTNLPAGTHTVTVTDANGCTSVATVTITEPTAVVATTVVDANVSCNGLSDGGVTVNVTGGTAPYTYVWSNTATTASITGLVAATYSVVVTDANGCTTTASATVTEPNVLTVSTTVQAVSCYGAMDGQITSAVTGGTAPYTYAWSNNQTTQDISGLDVGSYTVTVTDANGCVATSTTTMTQPPVLSVNATLVTNASCPTSFDGSAMANATGGVAPYTYLWDNNEVTATASALNSGVHIVSVVDANGCNQSSFVNIGESGVSDDASFAYSNAIYCADASNPTPTITGVTGGTFSGTPGLVINGTTGEINIQNSLTGTHTITYTTGGVCSNSSSVQVLIQPLEIASFSYPESEYCNYGGLVSPTVTGTPGGTWTSSSTGLALDPVTGEIDLDNSTIGYYSITYTTPGLCSNSAAWFMEIKGINTTYQINTITMVTVFHPGGDYQWMDCNDNYSHIALQDGQAYTPDQNGSYACEIQWRGCVDTTDCIDIVTIGTEDVELASSFDVYPNPTTGQFYVNFSADQDHITFKLYNTAGELISVEEMVHSNLMSFDIDLPKGVYLLEITNDQHESTTVRIVKQ